MKRAVSSMDAMAVASQRSTAKHHSNSGARQGVGASGNGPKLKRCKSACINLKKLAAANGVVSSPTKEDTPSLFLRRWRQHSSSPAFAPVSWNDCAPSSTQQHQHSISSISAVPNTGFNSHRRAGSGVISTDGFRGGSGGGRAARVAASDDAFTPPPPLLTGRNLSFAVALNNFSPVPEEVGVTASPTLAGASTVAVASELASAVGEFAHSGDTAGYRSDDGAGGAGRDAEDFFCDVNLDEDQTATPLPPPSPLSPSTPRGYVGARQHRQPTVCSLLEAPPPLTIAAAPCTNDNNTSGSGGGSSNDYTLAWSATANPSPTNNSCSPTGFSIEAFGEVDIDVDDDTNDNYPLPAPKDRIFRTGGAADVTPRRAPMFGRMSWTEASPAAGRAACQPTARLVAASDGACNNANSSPANSSNYSDAMMRNSYTGLAPSPRDHGDDGVEAGRQGEVVRLMETATSGTAGRVGRGDKSGECEPQSTMLMMRLQRRFEDMMLVSRVAT